MNEQTKIHEAQHRHTAAWLAEHSLAVRLGETEQELMLEPSGNPITDPVPVQVGQVRLLGRTMTPEIELPVYILVFRDWESGFFLVAPFSHYLSPADDGELATGRDEPALKVVSAWAGTSAHESVLTTWSWHVDDVGTRLAWDTFCVWRQPIHGEPLPERFLTRIGAPVISPIDPRIAHRKNTSKMLSRVFAETMRVTVTCKEETK